MLITGAITSCSEYNKIVKSSDMDLKSRKAIEYYEEGEYIKSLTLMEDAIPYYAGLRYNGFGARYDSLYFTYCMAHYQLDDYISAGYYFKRYAYKFPYSPLREEALFLSACCAANNSPNYHLDQTETLNALDEFQIFIDLYPNSERIDTCNQIMDRLRGKLELKRFEQCKQYYLTYQYQASAVAFESMLAEYPESVYKEDILYYIVKSNYLLASNSVESKKLERLQATLKSYDKFVAAFPNSSKRGELDQIKSKTEKDIKTIKEES